MDSLQDLTSALSADPDVQLAVVFGSAARGELNRRSDLDVGVMGLRSTSRLAALAVTLARIAGRHIDLIPLETAPPLLRFEIARDGAVMLERAPHLWPDFKARAMVDWWEWAPLARRFAAAAMGRLESQAGDDRREVASARIARATAWLQDAEALFGRDADAYLTAMRDRDLAILYLFLALQETIDLAAHWVADAGWGVPDDAGSTFDILADRGAIERGLADRLREGVDLRNRIAHGYAMLDYGRVRSEAPSGSRRCDRFSAPWGARQGCDRRRMTSVRNAYCQYLGVPVPCLDDVAARPEGMARSAAAGQGW